MPTFREKQEKLLLEYMDLLQSREAKEFLRLADLWSNISETLDNLITRLSELENLSENQLFHLDLYKRFLEESREIITVYNGIAEGIITNEQEEFASLGIQSAQELIGVSFSNRLNIEDVKYMIGNTREGTPLFNLLQESYPQTVDKITNTLVESMALGRGPIETARLMYRDMDLNLNRALLIARTEQLNVFRGSQTEQYKASGIVKGVLLITEPDACELCIAEETNNPHELGWIVDIHPNCRCGLAPLI